MAQLVLTGPKMKAFTGDVDGNAFNVQRYGYGRSAGIATINVTRSALQIAPEVVIFELDLSSCSFDTPAPASATDYDAQHQKLDVIWDTGDSGDFGRPVNKNPGFDSRDKANGLWIQWCYPSAGTYQVSATIIERTTGKVATASTSITVKDPLTEYASNIYCVGADFTGAPTGAETHTTLASAVTALEASAGEGVILFRRGESHAVTAEDFDGTQTKSRTHAAFGPSGDAAPVLTLDAGVNWDVQSGCTGLEFRWQGLDFQGPHDPTTPLGAEPQAENVFRAVTSGTDPDFVAVFQDCKIAGVYLAANVQHGTGGTLSIFHMDDCYVTDYRNYPLICDVVNCRFGLTGCRFAQNVNAPTYWPNTWSDAQGGAPVRLNGPESAYIYGGDYFHQMRHENGSLANAVERQPLLKLGQGSESIVTVGWGQGKRIQVFGSVLEGGAGVWISNAQEVGTSRITNARIEAVTHLASHFGDEMVLSNGLGISVFNCIHIVPLDADLTPLAGSGVAETVNLQGTGGYDQAGYEIRIEGNAFYTARTTAQNNSVAYSFVTNGQEPDLTTARDNISYAPNFDTPLGTTYEPLDVAQLSWFTAIFPLMEDPDGTTYADTANPSDAAAKVRPQSGSSALNGASVQTGPALDNTGTQRGTAAVAVSLGPWQDAE